MMRLTDYAVALHGAGTLDALVGVTTEAMSAMLGCDWAVVSLAPSIRPVPAVPRRWWSTHAADWEGLARRGQSLAHEDPVYTARLRLMLEGPGTYGRYMTPREFERTRLYDEVWRPTGAREVATYYNPGGFGFRLAAGRAGPRGFTRGELESMHVLGRHVQAATERLAADGRGSVVLDGRRVVVESSQWFVCARDGRILRWKPGAAEVYRAMLGPGAPMDRVPEAWRAVIERRAAGGPLEPLHAASEGRLITMYLSPIKGVEKAEEYSAFFVSTPAPADPLSALVGLGLTRREAEVLRWAAEGKTGPEIGIILGISALTAKKHMEHVLHRLGVTTRSAAVAAAVRAMHAG
jgi:DNA-binding CsgD family transcriptional regulator